MNKIKEATMKVIVDEAKNLFLEKSITDVSMVDIARKVGIGEATLYRYFGKKQNIVLEVATSQWTIIYNEFIENTKSLTGYEKISYLYNIYVDYYINHIEFYRFINEFDLLVLTDKSLSHTEYENEFDLFKRFFDEAYDEALANNEINPIDNPSLFYYSTTQAIFNLCKKLASTTLTKQDEAISKVDQVMCLRDMILYRLKK